MIPWSRVPGHSMVEKRSLPLFSKVSPIVSIAQAPWRWTASPVVSQLHAEWEARVAARSVGEYPSARTASRFLDTMIIACKTRIPAKGLTVYRADVNKVETETSRMSSGHLTVSKCPAELIENVPKPAVDFPILDWKRRHKMAFRPM